MLSEPDRDMEKLGGDHKTRRTAAMASLKVGWCLVTGQVGRRSSSGVELGDQFLRVPHEALDHPPAAFSGGSDERADHHEVVCALERAETAGDFLLELHHSAVAFGLVVGERDIGVGKEAQHGSLVADETQGEVVSDTTLLATGPGRAIPLELG